MEVRKTDGEFYKRSSLVSIRAGINRHLKDNYDGQIDIIKDSEFSEANQSFRAALVQLKKVGKGDVKHHASVDENDIKKLYNSGVFNQNNPQGLQSKVWFEIMVYVCRRGRENLRELKKDHFTVGTDSNGREFVAQAKDELTKKTREDNPASRRDAGRMYATGDKDCPVKSFKKYLEKLNPNCEALFQTPNPSAPESGLWYKNMPCGVHTLGNMMSTLSKKAGLSRSYTNHCLRATCITILDSRGFTSREICQASGHANEASIASYTGSVSDNRKQNISDALSNTLGKGPVNKVAKTEKPATVSRAPDVLDLENLENRDIPDINFDLGFTLTNSQELTLHEETEQTNILAPLDNNALGPDLGLASGSVNQASSTSTTHSHSRTMQFQQRQSPFVLNNCNVTINYFQK